MILLGHLHTHEFAVGGTTDQVGNPWALERSAGGSSGGSAAALAARMVPAATGTDTAGSLRIPSALCGTSTIKPTRGLVSLRGVVPLATSLDHAGPMARTLEDCAPLLRGDGRARPRRGPRARSPRRRPPSSRPPRGPGPLAGVRLALSPRRPAPSSTPTSPRASTRAVAPAGARRRPGRAASARRRRSTSATTSSTSSTPSCSSTTAASTAGASDYRPSLREWVEQAEARGDVGRGLRGRAEPGGARRPPSFAHWLAEHRIERVLEPTVPCVAPVARRRLRPRRQRLRPDLAHALLGLDGLPGRRAPVRRRRAQRPAGRRLADRRRPARDWDLLDTGIQLQAALGVPNPYERS